MKKEELEDACREHFPNGAPNYAIASYKEGIELGYKLAVEKACDVLKVILEDFLHGGDSDIVIALFEEKMEEEK